MKPPKLLLAPPQTADRTDASAVPADAARVGAAAGAQEGLVDGPSQAGPCESGPAMSARSASRRAPRNRLGRHRAGRHGRCPRGEGGRLGARPGRAAPQGARAPTASPPRAAAPAQTARQVGFKLGNEPKDEGRRTGESRRMSSGEATPGPSRRSIGADGSAAAPPPTRAAIPPARPAIAHDCQPGRAEKPEKQVMPRYAHLDGRREAEFARAHGPRCRARPRGGRGKERGGCWRRRTSARAPQMPERRRSAEPTLMQKVHRLAQSRAGERPAAQRPHRSATMSRAIAGGPEAMPNGLALGSPIPPHAAPPRSPADGIGG